MFFGYIYVKLNLKIRKRVEFHLMKKGKIMAISLIMFKMVILPNQYGGILFLTLKRPLGIKALQYLR